MTKQSTNIERDEMLAVLKRHPGSMSEIARSLGIRAANISNWLADRTGSKRIEKAVHAKVKALLKQEAAAKEASGDVDGPSVRRAIDKLRKAPEDK